MIKQNTLLQTLNDNDDQWYIIGDLDDGFCLANKKLDLFINGVNWEFDPLVNPKKLRIPINDPPNYVSKPIEEEKVTLLLLKNGVTLDGNQTTTR